MLNVYWSKDPRPGNFGDILTPYILDYYNIPYQFSKKNYDTICIGSIAAKTKENVNVLGSGIISKNDNVNPFAKWHFVRGPHTRDAVINAGGKCPEIYGDPALLLPLLFEGSKKEHEVGIVPHYVDYSQVKSLHNSEFVIDVLNKDPLEVVKQITKCKYILSSSLHGIIVANAYNIPAAWIKFSNNLHGDDIKFSDYFSSVGSKTISSTYDNPKFTLPKNIDITTISNIFKEFKNL